MVWPRRRFPIPLGRPRGTVGIRTVARRAQRVRRQGAKDYHSVRVPRITTRLPHWVYSAVDLVRCSH
ncbi:hypothetical protein SALB1_2369 [Salinisphaera sp. LB1]|nr:hypothetical protein SALB1_2369 [Salinisphaera sp. LB1]